MTILALVPLRSAVRFLLHAIRICFVSLDFARWRTLATLGEVGKSLARNLGHFVDLLLTRLAEMRKPRGEAGRKALTSLVFLVAGTGFEPVTFRL